MSRSAVTPAYPEPSLEYRALIRAQGEYCKTLNDVMDDLAALADAITPVS